MRRAASKGHTRKRAVQRNGAKYEGPVTHRTQRARQCRRRFCFDRTRGLYGPSRCRYVSAPHKTGDKGTARAAFGTIPQCGSPTFGLCYRYIGPVIVLGTARGDVARGGGLHTAPLGGNGRGDDWARSLRGDVAPTRAGACASIHFGHRMQFLY